MPSAIKGDIISHTSQYIMLKNQNVSAWNTCIGLKAKPVNINPIHTIKNGIRAVEINIKGLFGSLKEAEKVILHLICPWFLFILIF